MPRYQRFTQKTLRFESRRSLCDGWGCFDSNKTATSEPSAGRLLRPENTMLLIGHSAVQRMNVVLNAHRVSESYVVRMCLQH